MEFWGVEVKPGEPLDVTPAFGKLVHISQAALGEVKDVEGAKYVPLRLKIDSKDFIIGSLSAEDRTQVMFDLVFEKKFELSHDWKDGSVYFIGYIADDPVSDDEGFPYEFGDALEEEDESEEEEEPVKKVVENGTIKPKSGDVKATKAAAASKKEEESDSDEDDDDDSDPSSDEELGLLNEDSSDVSGDDSEDDEDESSSDEELPKKVQQSKKRPAESAQETPVPAKKAKAATPDKTGNKKGHTGTPFPSKAAGKGPGGNKSQGQTPKPAGQNKPFNNNKAQKSNGKGKHGGK